VLSPGEFNSMILELLPDYAENFMTMDVTVAMVVNIETDRQTNKQT